MQGLGDNIYQRAFLSKIKSNIYLETSWPEIYEDLPNVKPVKPVTKLRTQKKNIDKYQSWHQPPRLPQNRIHYRDYGIMAGLQRSIGITPGLLALPDYGAPPIVGSYVVVRPVTLRKEWRADARNPLPEYVDQAVGALQARGIKVVSVADLEDGQEWSLSGYKADVELHKGELDFKQLMALCAHSSGIVGGIGWIVPVSLAYQVPSFVVCGGWGFYNHPEKLKQAAQNNCVSFIMPDKFCCCRDKFHRCNKRITNFKQELDQWIESTLTMEKTA